MKSFLKTLLAIFIFGFIADGMVLKAQENEMTELDLKFLALENQLMEAVANRDRKLMEALVGDEYLLTSSDSNGGFIAKNGYINGSMNPEILTTEGFEFTTLSAQKITDDVVLVRSQLDWRSTFRGRPWNAEFLMTDVWQSIGGQWKLVSRHSSYPARELSRIVQERYSDQNN